MIYQGDNYHYCLECKRVINYGDVVIQGKWGYCHLICPERKNLCYKCHEYPVIKCGDGKHLCELCRKELNIMPNINIKITAEVDGKIVPLNTISTESFEAIKALEKSKEIPVAGIGNYRDNLDDRRLFLKITNSIRNNIVNGNNEMIAINLKNGLVQNSWVKNDVRRFSDLYENIQPL